MLSNAQQQPWGIVLVPNPVDCPLCLVDKHFIEGVGESTQAMLVLYVMSAERHCQMLVLRTATNPKSTPLTVVQCVSVHHVLILVLNISH